MKKATILFAFLLLLFSAGCSPEEDVTLKAEDVHEIIEYYYETHGDDGNYISSKVDSAKNIVVVEMKDICEQRQEDFIFKVFSNSTGSTYIKYLKEHKMLEFVINDNRDTGDSMSMGFDDVQKKYAVLTGTLIEKGLTISTMESCTSGLVASLLTDVDGASKATKGSFVTYSNEAKTSCGVPAEVIEKYGVYSKETAVEMAKNCKVPYAADIGVGVTGSLGVPDPNNADSIPGQVYFAIDYKGEVTGYFLEVENQGSKFLNKVYVADKICDELLKILK